MICALCKSDKTLCESHIYPKFTYKRMREDRGRFLEFSTERQGENGRAIQDGFKEKLLCEACEAVFQKWEDYFARVVNQKKLLDLERASDGKKWIRVPGFDYAKTKLFLLSILWRTHVSQHLQFRVDLGDRHEQRIRKMLLVGEPGLPEEYGCVIATPYVEFNDGEKEQLRPPVTVTPESVRWDHGLRLIRMQVDGIFLQFIVGNLELILRSDVRHLFMRQDGVMVVGIEDLTKIWFLRNSWGRALGLIDNHDVI